MLNWVDILRRILFLYNVKTQAELGMVLGMPINVGLERPGEDNIIPWPILEKVVMDRKVSWDWLLTGRDANAPDKTTSSRHIVNAALSAATENKVPRAPTPIQPPPPQPSPPETVGRDATRAPRIETRELERTLLPRDGATATDGEGETAPPAADASAVASEAEAIRRELEDIRATIRGELERVDRLLEGRELTGEK